MEKKKIEMQLEQTSQTSNIKHFNHPSCCLLLHFFVEQFAPLQLLLSFLLPVDILLDRAKLLLLIRVQVVKHSFYQSCLTWIR